MAAQRKGAAPARAFRHQLGRSRDAGRRLGRAALELYRSRPGRVRQGEVHRAAGEDPAGRFVVGGQFIRAEPALSLGRPALIGPRSRWSIVGLKPAFSRRRCRTAAAARRLVCVGRLCEQKGQLLLIEAARLLAERRRGVRTGARRRWRNARRDRGAHRGIRLTDTVRITGWISSDAGPRGNSRSTGAGVAELRRRLAGGHHGSHGVAPPGALRPSSPAFRN